MAARHIRRVYRSLLFPAVFLDFAAHLTRFTQYICLKRDIKETSIHAGIQYLPFAVNKLEGECFLRSSLFTHFAYHLSACVQLFEVVNHVQPVPLA